MVSQSTETVKGCHGGWRLCMRWICRGRLRDKMDICITHLHLTRFSLTSHIVQVTLWFAGLLSFYTYQCRSLDIRHLDISWSPILIQFIRISSDELEWDYLNDGSAYVTVPLLYSQLDVCYASKSVCILLKFERSCSHAFWDYFIFCSWFL